MTTSTRSCRSSARVTSFDAVVVIPGTQAEESGGRERLVANRRIHQIAGQLSLYELVVRQVVVEGANHPVAIGPGVRIRAIAARVRIQAAVVVFAVARHVEPDAAPALAIMRRREQTVDNLRERVGRIVFLERRLISSGVGGSPVRSKISAAQQIVFRGRGRPV